MSPLYGGNRTAISLQAGLALVFYPVLHTRNYKAFALWTAPSAALRYDWASSQASRSAIV
jgi:hypothetical protein